MTFLGGSLLRIILCLAKCWLKVQNEHMFPQPRKEIFGLFRFCFLLIILSKLVYGIRADYCKNTSFTAAAGSPCLQT